MPLDIVDDYKVEYADANLAPLGATAVGRFKYSNRT